MQDYWWWWGLAVLFGVIEMLTPTFYMLVLGAGFAIGGAVAFFGGDFAYQLLAAALSSFLGWYLLRRFFPPKGRDDASTNRDVLLDIGERVRIERWQPDRRAQVVYRGASWSVELSSDDPQAPDPGDYVIRRIDGNRLIVARRG